MADQNLIGTEILTFKEGVHWIACWKRYDMVAQGGSEMESVKRLLNQIAYQCIIDAELGKAPCAGVKPPPDDILAEWEQLYNECHKA